MMVIVGFRVIHELHFTTQRLYQDVVSAFLNEELQLDC
jgi:hypothetical protein